MQYTHIVVAEWDRDRSVYVDIVSYYWDQASGAIGRSLLGAFQHLGNVHGDITAAKRWVRQRLLEDDPYAHDYLIQQDNTGKVDLKDGGWYSRRDT